jgi:hypothetical protein
MAETGPVALASGYISHCSLNCNVINPESLCFHFQKDEGNAFKSLGTGNRIATFLFYVSILPSVANGKGGKALDGSIWKIVETEYKGMLNRR